MELVDGLDLAKLLRLSRVPVDVAIYIGRALLAALAHAHETAHIVHRDLSPHNALISWDGDVKLSDFGIAKAMGEAPTHGHGIRGKLRYMSPEHRRRERLDARSELFVVGLVLYRLLAGSEPYGDSDDDVCAVLLGDMEPASLAARCPWLASELQAVVARMMAIDPADRFQSAQEALDALPDAPGGRDELRALMQRLRELGQVERPRARSSGLRGSRWLYAALVLLGMGGGAGGLWGPWDAPVPAEPPPRLIMSVLEQPAVPAPDVGEPVTRPDSTSELRNPRPPGWRVGLPERSATPMHHSDGPSVRYIIDSVIAWPP